MDQLVKILCIPDTLFCPNGVKQDACTALAMLLRRLAYPGRLCDIELAFGWERSRVSRVANTLALFLYQRWYHLFHFDVSRLNPAKLEEYAKAIKDKGSPLENCWAFLDSSTQRVARPVVGQRSLYSGYKHYHGLKYQIMVSPDGIICHFFGPIESRKHDQPLYELSGLEQILRDHSRTPKGDDLVVFADLAYSVGRNLVTPFKGPDTLPIEKEFNLRMSKVRQAVEWGFNAVTQRFAYLDFYKSQKVLLQPVGLLYLAGVLLTNAHSIIHGSQASVYFSCPLPTLEEYFHGTRDDANKAWESGAGMLIPSLGTEESVEWVDSDAEDA